MEDYTMSARELLFARAAGIATSAGVLTTETAQAPAAYAAVETIEKQWLAIYEALSTGAATPASTAEAAGIAAAETAGGSLLDAWARHHAATFTIQPTTPGAARTAEHLRAARVKTAGAVTPPTITLHADVRTAAASLVTALTTLLSS